MKWLWLCTNYVAGALFPTGTLGFFVSLTKVSPGIWKVSKAISSTHIHHWAELHEGGKAKDDGQCGWIKVSFIRKHLIPVHHFKYLWDFDHNSGWL